MSTPQATHPQITPPLTTLSDFINSQKHFTKPTTSSSNTSSSNLSFTQTPTSSSNTSSSSLSTTRPDNTASTDSSTSSIKMAFGTRRRNQVVTRETKPTLMTRLRGRNAKTRTVKTTTTVQPTHGHAHTAGHTTTARRSRWGRNTRSTQPVVHHKRHASIGDKISGAMLKLKGSLTHRPGVKAAGTRRMHGTDGRGSHRVY